MGKGKPKYTLVDRFTLASLSAGKKFETKIRQFQWRFYAELAEQRSRISDELHLALLKAAVDQFEFKNWQRVIRQRWFLKPLSAAGSLYFPGGRFNIGGLEPDFASFPALYIASDKKTALQEVLGQDPDDVDSLSPLERALAKPDSVSFASMSGKLHTVIDLSMPERLQPFIDQHEN